MMPAHPTAHFVVAQARFPLGFLKDLFDPVTLAMYAGQLTHIHLPCGIAQFIADAWLGLDGSYHDKSFFLADTLVFPGPHRRSQHIDLQRAFFSVAHLHSLPT